MPKIIRTFERIPMSDFKAGDIIARYDAGNVCEYAIVALSVHENRAFIRGMWTGEGFSPARGWSNEWSVPIGASRERFIYAPRNCKPCYDSDCDCIHDQVGEESEEDGDDGYCEGCSGPVSTCICD